MKITINIKNDENGATAKSQILLFAAQWASVTDVEEDDKHVYTRTPLGYGWTLDSADYSIPIMRAIRTKPMSAGQIQDHIIEVQKRQFPPTTSQIEATCKRLLDADKIKKYSNTEWFIFP